MTGQAQTNAEQIYEISYLQERIKELEKSESDRKKAEKALRESETRFREMFDDAPIGYHELDTEGRITRINRTELSTLGYSAEEMLGRHVWEFVDEKEISRKNVLDKLAGTLPPGRDLERTYCRKDGTRMPVLVQDLLLRDKDGKITGIRTTVQDITERKRMEQALRESEELFRVSMEKAPDGVYMNDLEGNFLYGNHKAEEIIGCRCEELIGRNFLDADIIAKDSLGKAVELLKANREGKSTGPDELELIKKDGRHILIEVNTTLIQRRSNNDVLAFVRDITDRKRAEKTLQRQNVYLESLNETALGLMRRTDLTDLFQAIVARAMRLSGTDEGWIFIYNSEDGDFEYKAVMGQSEYQVGSHVESGRGISAEVLKTEQTVVIDDYHIWPKRASGREYDVRRATAAIPLQYEGRLAGVLGLAHHDAAKRFEDDELAMLERLAELASITLDNARLYDRMKLELAERKQAEDENLMLSERLRQADKMEAVGTLAGGIAHDFNNLLMGIQGYASLMLLDLDPSHPHYERLKRIEEQVQSGADLTKQLLGFARGGRYEVKPTDMNDALEKSSSMFGRTKKEITLHRKYRKDLWSVEVDRGQMEQVFLNLFVNAWQAMPGGGEIYLETENVLLSDAQTIPYTIKPGKYVKISVTDTGTGMDEKTRERIFDPFFTTKEMGRGTGLGLATVYGIVKGHQGAINVYSEPGRGTTFNIYLPASDREVIPERTETGTITMGTETILLVDDEKMVLEVNREMLESLGYRVYAAESGQEALSVYREKQQEIDLVLLDMIMPGISGGETFDHLREINPAARVLLSSGYSINGEAKIIMERGCNGFIQKPFQFEKLSGKVREILDTGSK
jgi:PAS domain S-box-containing protein